MFRKYIESNKYLYIKDKELVKNLYAIKIQFVRMYTLDKLDLFMRIWMKKLAEYMFLLTKYISVNNKLDVTNKYKIQDVLKNFNKTLNPVLYNPQSVYTRSELKRIYLDRRTALIHVETIPGIEVLLPSHWEDIEIIHMRPAYYCKPFDSITVLALG